MQAAASGTYASSYSQVPSQSECEIQLLEAGPAVRVCQRWGCPRLSPPRRSAYAVLDTKEFHFFLHHSAHVLMAMGMHVLVCLRMCTRAYY